MTRSTPDWARPIVVPPFPEPRACPQLPSLPAEAAAGDTVLAHAVRRALAEAQDPGDPVAVHDSYV